MVIRHPVEIVCQVSGGGDISGGTERWGCCSHKRRRLDGVRGVGANGVGTSGVRHW